jgi:hypothetical protein
MGIVIISIIYYNWNESKVILDKLKGKRGVVFSNLKIGSVSSGKMKTLLGFTVYSQIFIHPDYIFMLAQKINFSLVQTELPIVFSKKSGFVPETLKMNSWNSITVIAQKRTSSLGDTKIEILIETNSKEEKELLFEQFKNWNA